MGRRAVVRSGGDRLLGLRSQCIAQQPSAAQAAQPNPAQPAQPSPPSRHRAGPKCCNLRCGRTRRRQLTSTNVAVLRAGNLMVFARAPPEYKEKHWFLHASKEDRRGPVGDVRLARAAECIECIAAADCRSDTPLAARRIGSEPLVRLALSCAAIASYILCASHKPPRCRKTDVSCLRNKKRMRTWHRGSTTLPPKSRMRGRDRGNPGRAYDA